MKPKIFYKTGSFFIALFLCIVVTKCQNPGEKAKEKVKTFTTQEEEDWKKVEATVLSFADTPEENKKYREGSFWFQRQFEENIHKRNRDITLAFLQKYPQSDHYFDVLKFYFSYLVEPKFIDSIITEKSKMSILDQKKMIIKGDKSQFYKQFRTLPFDIEAKNKWVKEGDSLIQSFLNSNASMEEKALIEVASLGRDKRMARFLYEFLSPNKRNEESKYWALFDNLYWKEYIERIDNLIFKYPDYYKWPTLIDQFVTATTKDFLSPKLKEPLWGHFKKISHRPELFKKHPVIEQIYKKANQNINALEELKKFDKNSPLQMEFTSIDDQKLNLKDYREKVVLIDFWSIRCGPCIKEMPHIKAMYDKYKDKGFEVIGISAEDESSKQRILDVINKQRVNWPQVLDRSSDVMVSYHSLYKIHTLPTTWLLDKNGIIVDEHARGDRLEPLIKKYLEL